MRHERDFQADENWYPLDAPVEPYPGWLKVMIWVAVAVSGCAFYWGAFEVLRSLAR